MIDRRQTLVLTYNQPKRIVQLLGTVQPAPIQHLLHCHRTGRKRKQSEISRRPATRCKIPDNSERAVQRGMLTRNNLDYVHQFFLKYYRDGVAEVDHLDLEAVDAETGHEEIYITFQVSESRPPLSPEEAKKRLEDWS